MKRMIKILAVSLVIGGILAAVLAGTVLAAGPSGGQTTTTEPGEVSGWHHSRGLGFGSGSAAAELLGMTPEEIREQRQAGKSLVEIARDRGIDEATLINAIMAEKRETIQKLVTEGTMTQAEADARLAQIQERVTLAVNRTMTGPPEWAGASGRWQNGTEKGNAGGNGFSNGKGKGNMGQNGYRGNHSRGAGMNGNCAGSQMQPDLY